MNDDSRFGKGVRALGFDARRPDVRTVCGREVMWMGGESDD